MKQTLVIGTERTTAYKTKWPVIVDSLAHAFRMTTEEREWLAEKPIAQLIGAIPFFAGVSHPARTAVAHVGTYLLSVSETKPFFNATMDDDEALLDRLNLIAKFTDGDQEIIDRGMALIALAMVEDYQRDIQIDAATGKYNPVASGAFDYEAARAELLERIETVECKPMDEILKAQEMGTRSFWGRT